MTVLPARIEDGYLRDGFWTVQTLLPRIPAHSLDDELLGRIEQRSRLRQRVDRLGNFGISLDRNFLRLFKAETRRVHFPLQLHPDPGAVVVPIGVRERDVLLLQVIAELVDYAGIRLPTLGKLRLGARSKPLRGEIEERKFTQHVLLELVVLGRRVLLVGGNSAATVNRPAAVGALDVLEILGLGALAVVVVEE